jgi:Tfp pilus assembly protein PilN
VVDLLNIASSATPKEVWFSALKADVDIASFTGSTNGFMQLTALIKNLSSGSVLTDVELASSHQEKNSLGIDLTNFELRAKRKKD